MLQNNIISVPAEAISAWSFEVSATWKQKDALLKQVLTAAKLHSGELVLDLSCTAGDSSKMLATLSAVEPNPLGGFPGLLRINSVETDLCSTGNGDQLPWSAESFDTIICLGVFNQLVDQSTFIAEIHRLLSPGGKLIIADQWFRKAGPMFASLLQPYACGSEYRIYSPALVTKLLKKSGFGLIETLPAGATNFLCLARAIK